ncbi:hypothetical protein [Streptomyces lydicus]|uniref:hypothetical protein n=1 Tax=Streptomyces lydicus TaxID=47763 RepID=UPI002870AEF5|nr:hypothetical protein [Streptomyces lydicus]
MRKDRQLRRLVVGEDVWLWSVRHRHEPGPERGPRPPECREVLSLHHGTTRATVRIVFRERPGRILAGAYLPGGAVAARAGGMLNLHEPGVVRRFLDALPDEVRDAMRGNGPGPSASRETELDGWPLFDALTAANPG